MGTGLFAGDDLNPNFPEGDGVQLFLTFELPGVALGATSAVLASNALTVFGTPFEDLGPLSAEVVTYDTFGPHLFDTPALSDAVPCAREGEAALRCDVTDIVRPLLTDGETAVQLRLRFAVPSDLDGRQDLALFFRSDSNTNEPGLFTLTIGR